MSTKTHTPGPWRVHPKNNERVIQSSEDIAVMCGIFRDTIEREANARLIAAAPELLAMVKKLRNYVGHYASMPHAHPDAYKDEANARQLIRQATGDTNA